MNHNENLKEILGHLREAAYLLSCDEDIDNKLIIKLHLKIRNVIRDLEDLDESHINRPYIQCS
jgi:hypothetical protein